MVLKQIVACFILAPALLLPCRAAAQASEDPSDRYADEGQRALAEGRYSDARTDFEQLAKLHPEVAEVHASLAAIYFKLGEYQLAVKAIHTAQKLKPGLPRLDSLLGLSLSEMSRFDEALPHLDKGFKQTADAEVRRMCGLQLLRAYTNLGRDADAVEVSLQLNKLYPDDAEVLYNTGRIYGNFAYLVMTKLHDSAPNSVWMLQAQGEANEAAKDYAAAIVAYNHVLEIDPKRPGIHYRLGRVYLARLRGSAKAEDHDAAVREFNAELAIDPGNGNALYEMAVLQQDGGNLDEARTEFEHLVEQFPDFEQALVGLGGVCLQTDKAAAAVAPLERATKIDPSDEVAWYRLAQAERATGNREAQQKAIAEFQRLRQATPSQVRRPNEDITPQQIPAGAKPE